MKKNIIIYKLLFILLLSPFFCKSQSQIVNGIDINGPKGFIKTDDLTWRNGNDIIQVLYLKQNKGDWSKEFFKQTCENGTRTTDFFSFEEFIFNGDEYHICYQIGKNKMVIGQVPVFVGEYTYVLSIGTNMLDYKSDQLNKSLTQVQFNMGYMINRILTY